MGMVCSTWRECGERKENRAYVIQYSKIFKQIVPYQNQFTLQFILYSYLMLKVLHRASLRCFFSSNPAEAAPTPTPPPTKLQYLLIPTLFPVSPYYFYSTRINKHLYEFIQKNKIRYMAAFPIRPGVYRRNFYPHSLEDFETELGLSNVIWPDRSNKPADVMPITHNNVLYDGVIVGDEEVSVKIVSELDQLYPIGTICNVNLTNDDKNHTIFLRAEIRLEAEWAGPANSSAVMLVSGKTLKAEPLKEVTREYEELLELYTKIREISTVNLPDIDIQSEKAAIKIVELMSGYLCTLSYFSQDQLYRVFKETAIQEKISLLLRYYKDYFNVLDENWTKLTGNEGDEKNRKKEAVHTVYENMKRIVGNTGEQKYIDKIRLKLKERPYPEHVRKLIESELTNLESEGSHDVSRKKHYINLLSEYPFGILAKEEFDIQKAKKILEEDHYGMNKLKQRILEFIAVSKLKGEFKSKVLLLYGPPGVGKTSIVKSIAKCLGRPYARVSLGGEYDTSIIKGHRRTYVGAYPGKIWDCIYKSKAENPVILLDEIDKIMNRSNGANLQDAVMEVLDPVQNYKFKDDFMDVEVDLSRVLFICTANTLDTIFPPLLDRLQRIEVSGYTTIEKLQIFKRYILTQSMDENGLNDEMKKELIFSEDTAKHLIQGYCKEAGVRNLVRKTNKIFQKIALKYVKNIDFPKTIQRENIKEYIGLPVFHDSRLFPGVPPAGVMIGLAYNNFGGSIMYIQCANQNRQTIQVPSTTALPPLPNEQHKGGALLVTGNIHDVMKESCQLAYTYAKYIASTFFNNHYLENNDVHLNFPEIEIGKDGPSAGVAITSALISLAINKSAVREIAMTGQITLAGRVSPIGGVKQKTMGAKRQGITSLIFPEDNRKDVEQLQAEIKEGMTFYFAKHYFEVMDLLFGIKIQGAIKVEDFIKGGESTTQRQSVLL